MAWTAVRGRPVAFLAFAVLLAIAAGASAQTGSPPVRRIAPELIAPPEIESQELRRDAPRAPLSAIGPAGAARPVAQPRPVLGAEPERPKLLRPVAVAAGRLESETVVIQIAGIDILEPGQTCGYEKWPCGNSARTAFRAFLRGRALDCDVPPEAMTGSVSSACRVSGQDLGAWLVSNGWAKVAADGPYAEEQQQAVEERRGMFGAAPPALPGSGGEPAAGPGQTLPAAGEAAPPGAATPAARPGGLY